MTHSTTSRLALPFLQPGQALKTITHNEALQRLDMGLYLSCSDMAAEDLPAVPEEGQTLILSAAEAAALSDHIGDIGVFYGGVWNWFTPKPGWSLWDESGETLRIFDGSNWASAVKSNVPESLPQLGLNTSAASHQRLAIASQTSLFSHDGSDHRLTINRATEPDVASLVFQTDFVGEAEMGLAGPDGFSIKTSVDGQVWSDRLSAPKDYLGVRAPAFGSRRVYVGSHSAEFIETPATGGLVALTIVSDGEFPRVSHSGLLAYDTGKSPALVVLAKTARLEIHGEMILDGTVSAPDNIGVSAVEGGLYLENGINSQRIISVTFLC